MIRTLVKRLSRPTSMSLLSFFCQTFASTDREAAAHQMYTRGSVMCVTLLQSTETSPHPSSNFDRG